MTLPGARVDGRATWIDGRWRLVLTRGLAGPDVDFPRGVLIPFGLHAWDGGRGERDLLMSVSSWSFVFLQPERSLTAPLTGVVTATLIGGGELLLMRRRRSGRR